MLGALEILKRERDEASENIRTLRTRIKDLDQAIAILEGQPAAGRAGKPSGDLKLIVLNQLRGAGSFGATPKEIATSLTNEGRQTSDATVSSVLSRLKGEAKVANFGGRWTLASQREEDTQANPSKQDASEWEFDDDSPF